AADVAAGRIDQEQARALRKRIAKEADFYGAMDGAAKFGKGDAIAAILIVAVNLVGGFAIGMGSHHMPFGQAISTYSLLSVGDGLVAQIPALLISIATGLLVTRVGDDGSLGTEAASQLLARRDALRAAAVVVGLLGLLPGLPKLPFLGLVVALFVASSRPQQDGSRPDTKLAERSVATNPDDPQALLTEIRVDPLELELGHGILDLSSAIVTPLAEIVRRNAADLLSRQDVQAMIEGLRYEEPLLAQEVGSDLLPVSTLQGVLRGLLAEQVPVRDLSRIVDTVAT